MSWNSHVSRLDETARDPCHCDHLAKVTGIGLELGIARS